MSGETNTTHETGQNSLTLGLSLLGGLGVTLMIVAGGVGVIGGDANTIGLLFVSGLALFITGALAWAGVVQPWAHFDDINIPAPDEHHTAHGHDETAIVPHEPHLPQPHH